MNIAIGVLYFMPEESYISNEYCIPIQLGFHETGIDMGIQKDNEGDHRALKHPLYSEYSGIYWLWKNVNADYKGMLHHRRALTLDTVTIRYYSRILKNWSKSYIKCFLLQHSPYMYAHVIDCSTSEEYNIKRDNFLSELPHILELGYDIVVPKPYHLYWTNVGEIFDEVVNRMLLAKLKHIIKINYPIYYDYFLNNINGTLLYYSNINIMKTQYFDEYNEFAFGCFDQLEEQLVNEGYYINPEREKSLYRIFGYIGELLLSTYIHKKKKDGLKIKELPLLFNKAVTGYDDSQTKTIKL